MAKFKLGFIDAEQIHPSVEVNLTYGDPFPVKVVQDRVIEGTGDWQIRVTIYDEPLHDVYDRTFAVEEIKDGRVVRATGFLSYEDAKRFLHEKGPRRFEIAPGRYEVRECLGIRNIAQ